MSSAESDAQRYFRSIEEHFIRLRGSPLLLSPEDWRQAEEWHRRGIPLEIVLGVIEQLFSRRTERGASGKIQSLRYFAPAVEAAWQEISSLTAAGRRREPESLDVDARLRALAAALPPELPDRQRLVERISALGGDTSEVEAGLATLDEEMIAGAVASLTAADREPLERRTRKALDALAGRVGEEELDEVRRRLLRQALRRARRLPVLSLFSPEAAGGD